MWLRDANGIDLVSAKTAEAIVRLIVADEFGQAEVERNEPLSVRDDGESWLVSGSQPGPAGALDPKAPSWAGPVQVRIAKFDGRILDYSFTIIFDPKSSGP
jgi:hypothetical protein